MDNSIMNLIDLEMDDPIENEYNMVGFSHKDVAIIGVGLKFPRANTVEELWDILSSGRDCTDKVPWDRQRDMENYYRAMGDGRCGIEFPKAAYLDHIDRFDYRFFNLSPKEAELMDPGQRLFLETVWQAIEDAGYGDGKIRGSRTGVFVGYSNEAEYKKLISDMAPDMLSISVAGNLPAVIPGRVSYLLDLKGPSLLVNTACSSSLVAVHLACQTIKNGECSMAIAGGVRLNIFPVVQTKLGIESSDGRTRTFDNSSDGMGGGEGIGVVLLKSLNQAIKDRDHIYAVIKGSAYNQDGASMGISAPNPAAHEDVITRAWKEAGIDPVTITYIEAHGTGTEIGDPIEIDGIQRAFRKLTDRRQFCAVGSIKSNIGHLDASAGIAGLLKAVLALKYGKLPPTVHFERPNRKIPFYKSPVYVNTSLVDWEIDCNVRRCGVSSFGFSGTNCHVVLEEAPKIWADHSEESHDLLLLSAKTKTGLKKLVKKYSCLDYKSLGTGNVCYTANTGRGHYNHRLAIAFKQADELTGILLKLTDEGIEITDNRQIFYGVHKDATPNKAVAYKEEITPEYKREITKKSEGKINEFLASGKQNIDSLYELGCLYVKGADVNWEMLYKGENRRRVSIPTYPFESNRCWIETPRSEDLYYRQVWKRRNLQKALPNTANNEIMVFGDARGVAGRVTAQLRGKGKKVIEVMQGEKYCRIHEDSFIVGCSEEDYDTLISETKYRGITQIVHMFSAQRTDKQCTAEGFEDRLGRGAYSLLFLSKALDRHDRKDMDIVLISMYADRVDGSEIDVYPENSALFGLGKAINAENFNLKCRCLDFDDDTELVQIIEELEADYHGYNTAYRKGIRYSPEISDFHMPDVIERPTEIKMEGIYVIAGGRGGIGLEIAKCLAARGNVNLALINRTPLPARDKWESILKAGEGGGTAAKIESILEIEGYGACVECCCADITVEQELEAVLKGLRSKYGKINGIIQSAGVGIGKKGRRCKDEDISAFQEVVSSKIKGTWNLEKLSCKDSLDFFILFSSPITITGGVGSGSYIAANAFLDAFAAYRNRLGKRTITISWAPWEKTIQLMNEEFDRSRHMFETLTASEIVNAFEEVIDKGDAYTIVGRLNYGSQLFKMEDILPFKLSEELASKIREKNEKQKPDEADANAVKTVCVRLKGSKDDSYTETEKKVAEVFGNILGYRELDINDNFYEIGGDSIIALKIVNTIKQKLALEVVITDLLKNPSLKKFAEHLDSNYSKGNRLGEGHTYIPKAASKEFYEASSSQKRLFLIRQYQKDETSWNISYVMSVEGNLDRKRFEEAFKQLMQRHEALRTSFHVVGGKIMQKINAEVEFKVDYFECDENCTNMEKEFIKPYELSSPPLFRVKLVKLMENKHFLLFDIHHIISDEISMEIIMRELAALYEGKVLQEPTVQYKDFSEWQNRLYEEGAFSRQENYWLDMLCGEIPVLELPLDYPRPSTYSFEGEKIDFTLGPELTQNIKNLARKTDTTEYWLLMAAFIILLSKHSGQEDLVVGVPVYGRSHSSLENTMGMFVNVLPLRSHPIQGKTFLQFLEEVKDSLVKAYENQDYPFDRLVEKLKIDSKPNRAPLFDVSFQMHKILFREMGIGNELKFIPVKHEDMTSKQDILLEAHELENIMYFSLVYCTRLFKRETMERFANSFINILEQVIHRPNIVISDIGLMSVHEVRTILDEFNEKFDDDF